MPQQHKYDAEILRQIKNGNLILDIYTGNIFSKNEFFVKKQIGFKKNDGHIYFSLNFGDKRPVCYVCRAIYLSVAESIDDGNEVYHFDGNKENNAFSNLRIRKYIREYPHLPKWTDDDLLFLKNNYNIMSYGQLSDKFNRSDASIRQKCQELGLVKIRKKRVWTEEDDKNLKEMYQKNIPLGEIAKFFNSSKSSICIRSQRILKVKRAFKSLQEIGHNNFYHGLKHRRQLGKAEVFCCICNYSKHIDLHHLDGNHKNNHISNIATLCPNHHREVEAGEHDGRKLYSVWRRVTDDEQLYDIENNKNYVTNNLVAV